MRKQPKSPRKIRREDLIITKITIFSKMLAVPMGIRIPQAERKKWLCRSFAPPLFPPLINYIKMKMHLSEGVFPGQGPVFRDFT